MADRPEIGGHPPRPEYAAEPSPRQRLQEYFVDTAVQLEALEKDFTILAGRLQGAYEAGRIETALTAALLTMSALNERLIRMVHFMQFEERE